MNDEFWREGTALAEREDASTGARTRVESALSHSLRLRTRPLWVISGHTDKPAPCPLCSQKRTIRQRIEHVCFMPEGDSSLALNAWEIGMSTERAIAN